MTSRRQSKHDQWAIWFALVGFNIVTAVVSQYLWLFPAREPYSFGNYAAFGIALSHAAMAATVLVLLHETFARRLVTSLTILATSWITFSSCLLIGLKEARDRPVVAIGGCFAVIFGASLLSQLPLWIARLTVGWRITKPGEAAPKSPGNQFGIAGLLILTAAVAVVVLIVKTTVQLTATELRGRLLIVFAIAIGACLFALLPAIIRLDLRKGWSLASMAIVAAFLLVPLLLFDTRMLSIFFCELAFSISLVVTSTMLFRRGYRLNK